MRCADWFGGRWRGALAAPLLLAAMAVHGAPPSELPAIASPEAHERLMLDVALAGDRLVAVGEHGHVVYSDDGGASWTHASVPISLMLTGVTAVTPERLWAVGHEGTLLVSDDAGASWRVRIDGTDIVEMQIDAAERAIERLQRELDALADDAAAEVREALEFALEDAEFDLEDAEQLVDGGLTSPLLGVHFVDADLGFAYGAYGVLLRSDDGGDTWSLIASRLDNPDNNHLYAMTVANGALLLSGEAGVLFRSGDLGASWQRLDAGYAGSLFGLATASDGSVITFGLRGRIFHSDDNGDTWTAAASDSRSTLFDAARTEDGRLLLVGAGGTMLVSRDNGRVFSAVDTGTRDALSAVTLTHAGALVVAGFGGVRPLAAPASGD